MLDTRQRLVARVFPSPSSKRKTAPADTDKDEDCRGRPPSNVFEDPRDQSPGSCTTSAPPRKFKRPVGQKIAKLDLRAVQAKECAMRAHAKATTDVAAANMARAHVLHDQAALALFTISDEGAPFTASTQFLGAPATGRDSASKGVCGQEQGEPSSC